MKPMSEIRIPYGKFKDYIMEDIPSGYLKYIAENFDQEDLCFAADTEWQEREKFNTHWEIYD